MIAPLKITIPLPVNIVFDIFVPSLEAEID